MEPSLASHEVGSETEKLNAKLEFTQSTGTGSFSLEQQPQKNNDAYKALTTKPLRFLRNI